MVSRDKAVSVLMNHPDVSRYLTEVKFNAGVLAESLRSYCA